jgi:hypothetical protein
MFASKTLRRKIRRLIPAGFIALAACDDPTMTRPPPGLSAMTLFLILDPDAEVQPLLVKPAETVGGLGGLAGEIRRGGTVVASVPRTTGAPENEFYPCAARYGALQVAPPRCLSFAHRPEYGATYTVSASADAYPLASGSTTVPGNFTITSATASGTPPGTGGLRATWTRSMGVYRYIVTVRPASAPECVTALSCEQGWFVATQDTVIDAAVPAEALSGGGAPFHLDVYAVDEALYQYLTTGTSGNLFPVGAVQNVRGGYGAVGSWVRRSQQL